MDGEEIKVMKKGWEKYESIICETEKKVIIGDDWILLCFWDFYYFVDSIKNFYPFYSHILVSAAYKHSFQDRDDGLEFFGSIVVGIIYFNLSIKKLI